MPMLYQSKKREFKAENNKNYEFKAINNSAVYNRKLKE